MAGAAAQDVELVAFPETFPSGHPFWLELTGGARFDDPAQKRAYAAYLEAAVAIDGSELRQIAEAARDLGVFVYLGTTERATGSARGTVFCTLVAIDAQAGVVSTHRKLIPTYEERLVWGTGDGHGLLVHQYAGTRVGGLNCWENWMPQARHALYAQGGTARQRLAGHPAQHRRHHPVRGSGGSGVLPRGQRPDLPVRCTERLPALRRVEGDRRDRLLPRRLRDRGPGRNMAGRTGRRRGAPGRGRPQPAPGGPRSGRTSTQPTTTAGQTSSPSRSTAAGWSGSLQGLRSEAAVSDAEMGRPSRLGTAD